MNRRKFFGMLSGLPLVSIFSQSTDGKDEIQQEHGDVYEIFSPREIRLLRGYDGYVDTPIMRRGDRIYHTCTFKLKTIIAHECLFETPRNEWIEDIQLSVLAEIRRVALTHVKYVRFNNVPIYRGMNDNGFYCAFIRGFNVNGRCSNHEELFGK